MRLSLRLWAKSPGSALLVVLTLALGIGAATALFSVVSGVLLDPLPYPDSSQLVAVYAGTPRAPRGYVTYPNFLDWQRAGSLFSGMAIYRHADRLMTGAAKSQLLTGEMVSADFFGTLGVNPVLGRDLRPGDDQLGAAPVAVLGGRFWRQQFGGSPAVLGHVLDLDGIATTVVGVIPPSFTFQGAQRDVYTALGNWSDTNLRQRGVDVSTLALGRLRPGVTLPRAQSQMDAIARALAQRYPKADSDVTVALVSMKQDVVGDAQSYLLVLLAAVGFLLLIACGNAANVLLARSSGRQMEFAIRTALGAGRGRLARQLLAESAGLALAGGAVGLALAAASLRAMVALLPASLPRANNIRLDAHVLWFAVGAALFAGLAAGGAPALGASRAGLQRLLRAGPGGGRRQRGQAAFAALAIALAAVLLTGTGLMLRTLESLARVNPGYDPAHTLTFDVAFPVTHNTNAAQTRARMRALDHAIARLPGVVAESLTTGTRPMVHESTLPFWILGRPKPPTENAMPQGLLFLAEAGYVRAMGMTVEHGRFLAESDNENAPPVVVIDDVFARQNFPDQNPLGQRVNFVAFDGITATIVGVVAHVNPAGLASDPSHGPQAEFFIPYLQLPPTLMPLVASGGSVIVRSAGDPESLVAPVRAAIASVDPRETVYQSQTFDDLIAASLAPRRATLALLALFGALALLLAAAGTYGVVACLMAQRTREIGIRMALGGSRRDVLRLVLADGVRIGLWGVIPGLLIALALTRLMRSLLYQVSPADPVSYAAAGAILFAAALLAAYLPARRATSIDPLIALRSE
ncbi:MAG: ADOP family duplicated permease [Terriglobales bacterium]